MTKTRQQLGAWYSSKEFILKAIERLPITKNTTFLDPSCGHGYFFDVIHSVYPDIPLENFHGIDIDPQAVKKCKEKYINIKCEDALFSKWVDTDIVLGNPPFLGRYKFLSVLGCEYRDKIMNEFYDIRGNNDLAVYFLRKAHQHSSKYASFITPNIIKSSSDCRRNTWEYVLNNGGKIYNVHTNLKWDGDANVFVDIVTWAKDGLLHKQQESKYNQLKLEY